MRCPLWWFIGEASISSMKAVMLEVPESLLAERRAKGLDLRDEVWEGVLHMVPQPAYWQQRFAFLLAAALEPIARPLGLELAHETSVARSGEEKTNYRVPDLVVTRADQRGERGVHGAETIFEVLSP